MSGFCGFLSRRAAIAPLERGRIESAARALSRDEADTPVVLSGDFAVIAAYDAGAFGKPEGLLKAKLRIGAVAGDPVWTDAEGTAPVAAGRVALLNALQEPSPRALDAAKGSFAAFAWDASGRRLDLVADAVGTRPLYYLLDEDACIFATNLRTLLELAGDRPRIDETSVAELVLTRALVGNYTPYSNIKLLRGGECLSVTPKAHSLSRYFEFPAPDPRQVDYDDAVRRTHQVFMQAVRRRLRAPRVEAMLSGGLDSRAVVAALVDLGVDVSSMAFAEAGTFDDVLSQQAAMALGVRHRLIHFQRLVDAGRAPFLGLVRANLPSEAPAPEARGRQIWSGDGGSVLLGAVYMTEANVAEAERLAGEEMATRVAPESAPQAPAPLLSPSRANALKAEVRQRLAAELEAGPPGDRLFHYYLRNNQARHLHHYFENIDLWRSEPVLPFFDRDFAATVCRLPREYYLRHRLYHDLLALFRAPAAETPWQAYGDHLPCPHPLPEGVVDQWTASRSFDRQLCRRGAAWISELLSLRLSCLNRGRLRLSALVLRAGLRRRYYVADLSHRILRALARRAFTAEDGVLSEAERATLKITDARSRARAA
jgi:hypothetical protein